MTHEDAKLQVTLGTCLEGAAHCCRISPQYPAGVVTVVVRRRAGHLTIVCGKTSRRHHASRRGVRSSHDFS